MQWFLWIIAILLAAGAGYWVYRADKRRAVPYPWLTSLLRGLVVLLTCLLLFAPAITIDRNETQKPVILFLQDNSRSIAHALKGDSSVYEKNAQVLIDKLEDKYRVVTWGFGNRIQNDSLFDYTQSATDIATALTRAQEFYGTQNLGAVILATDGRYNQGANPAYQQLSIQSPLYAVALGDSTAQKDLRIAQVYANKVVTLNSQFEIRADIAATLCNGYNNSVQLRDANGGVLASSAISVNTDRYDRSVSFTVKASSTGLHHYVISAPRADGEQNEANNRRDIFVEVVDEQKKVLIAAAAPHPDVNAIKEALNGLETYKVTVATGDNLPAFDNYDVIVAHQLPSNNSNAATKLQSARKPTWYIAGSQVNAVQLNQLQKVAMLNINPVAARDVYASFNNSFNAFTLPQNLRAVTDKLPPLSVPVGSIQAAPNTLVLFDQKGNDDNDVPLWLMQQGTVPMAMVTGEGLWRWRLYEYKNFGVHSVIDECIRQTITFLAANTNDKPFRVELPKYVWSDQEAVGLNAYLLNANNEQVNTPEAQLTITDSAGKKQNFSFERAGNAYKLNAGVWAGGNYTFAAKTVYNGRTYTETGSFVVESMPLELMETGADYPLLYSLANKYNGSLVPGAAIGSLYDSISNNQNIKPLIQTNTESVPLVDWKLYFFFILLLAVAEWLLRKYWLAQ